MADVTVVSRQDNINGHVREIFLTMDIAADADTYDSKMTSILSAEATSQAAGNNNIGVTLPASGGIVTFQVAGAETGALVVIRGF